MIRCVANALSNRPEVESRGLVVQKNTIVSLWRAVDDGEAVKGLRAVESDVSATPRAVAKKDNQKRLWRNARDA